MSRGAWAILLWHLSGIFNGAAISCLCKITRDPVWLLASFPWFGAAFVSGAIAIMLAGRELEK